MHCYALLQLADLTNCELIACTWNYVGAPYFPMFNIALCPIHDPKSVHRGVVCVEVERVCLAGRARPFTKHGLGVATSTPTLTRKGNRKGRVGKPQ